MFNRPIPFLFFCIPLFLSFLGTGCARLYGWDIHAPGVLSNNYFSLVRPETVRLALYLPPDMARYESKDKGGRMADPQTFHIGEAFEPMILEAFQHSFDEFLRLETEPSPELMQRYQIPYLVIVRIQAFHNDLAANGSQRLEIVTETLLMDSGLRVLDRFESKGISDAQKIFSKKGGPEVNLNAAIENNIRAIVEHVQDRIKERAGKSEGPA